ncbi:MAG: hypothetical protein AB7L09_25325 [Nitrospira sp.]
MRVKSMMTVGFLSIVVATGVASAPDGAASETQRVNSIERMGAGGSAYSSNHADGVGTCPVTGVNAIERIGHGGSTYSFSRSKSVHAGDCHTMRGEEKRANVVARIGAGGSTYSSGSTMSN